MDDFSIHLEILSILNTQEDKLLLNKRGWFTNVDNLNLTEVTKTNHTPEDPASVDLEKSKVTAKVKMQQISTYPYSNI